MISVCKFPKNIYSLCVIRASDEVMRPEGRVTEERSESLYLTSKCSDTIFYFYWTQIPNLPHQNQPMSVILYFVCKNENETTSTMYTIIPYAATAVVIRDTILRCECYWSATAELLFPEKPNFNVLCVATSINFWLLFEWCTLILLFKGIYFDFYFLLSLYYSCYYLECCKL